MMPITLYYLSSVNLLDRLFRKEFFAQMGKLPSHKALVLHANTGTTPEDAYFVSKRVSALLSEHLVTSMALPTTQRLVFEASGKIHTSLLDKSWTQLDAIVAPLYTPQGEAVGLANAVQGLRAVYSCSPLRLFTENPMSALAAQAPLLKDIQAAEALFSAFEEEATVLKLAAACAPAHIQNPQALSL